MTYRESKASGLAFEHGVTAYRNGESWTANPYRSQIRQGCGFLAIIQADSWDQGWEWERGQME